MIKSGFFLFLGLLLGRFLGLFRELLLAGSLGSGPTADTIIALITLPDIFISVFVGNSLVAVFTPKIKALPPKERFGFFLKLNLIFGLIFFAIAALASFKLDWIAELILPAQGSSTTLFSELRWIIWAVPLLALNAISRVFLQSENKFALLGLENVIFNIFIIGAIYLFTRSLDLRTMSIAIILGSLTRLLSQVWQISSLYQKTLDGYPNKVNRQDFTRYGHALFTGILIQVLPVYARSIASHFSGDGGLSIFNYSYKFIEFPMALGISIVSLVIYPRLTQAVVEKNQSDHSNLIKNAQEFILTLCVPGCFLMPALLVRLTDYLSFFPNTKHIDLYSIFIAVAIGSSILFLRGLNELFVVILNSLHDVRSPLISTAISSALGFLFIYAMTFKWGIFGGFWGLNISFVIMFFLNTLFLTKLHKISLTGVLNAGTAELFFSSAVAAALFYIGSRNISFQSTIVLWTCLLLVIYLFLFRKTLKRKINRHN